MLAAANRPCDYFLALPLEGGGRLPSDGLEFAHVDVVPQPGGFPSAACWICHRSPCVVLVHLHLLPELTQVFRLLVETCFLCAEHQDRACHLTPAAIDAAARQRARAIAEQPRQLRFPAHLPPNLLEALGYRGDDRLVGLYWYAIADVLVLYGRRGFVAGPYGIATWNRLLTPRMVRAWLREHEIELGSHERAATHHLILDRRSNTAVVARSSEARRIVARQTLESGAPAGGRPG